MYVSVWAARYDLLIHIYFMHDRLQVVDDDSTMAF
jgi:hypothetical protein